jgi:hypothetical protein
MSHHASGPNFGFPRGDARLDMTDLYAFTKPGDPASSIIALNVHPSFRLDSPEPTTKEPFAPGALYELKIDTDGDAIANLGYSVQFASSEDGQQTATVRRIQGKRAGGVGDDGEVIIEEAPVSVGREALVPKSGDYRCFFGWRSDPFCFDVNGNFNHMQFAGRRGAAPAPAASGRVLPRWSARPRPRGAPRAPTALPRRGHKRPRGEGARIDWRSSGSLSSSRDSGAAGARPRRRSG